jgi:hypothetical protein
LQLWLATIVGLDENEDEKYIHIIHNYWCPTLDENFVVFTTSNVVHKWLDNMWCSMLQLYIIVANIHMLTTSKCMQHVMLSSFIGNF